MKDQLLEEVVKTAQAGCKEAHNELCRRFHRFLLKLALRYVYDENDALDVVQNTLMTAFVKIGQLREPEAYAKWLAQIVTRLAINHLNRTRPAEEALLGDMWGEKIFDKNLIPVECAERNESAELVRGFINELNDNDRHSLHDYYFAGLSLKKIAKKNKIPLGTAKRRLWMARQRLKAKMS
jgi:RNA polymerase sigma-70 factor (ECF subfamily)